MIRKLNTIPCKSCGLLIRDTDRFCRYCGAAAAKVENIPCKTKQNISIHKKFHYGNSEFTYDIDYVNKTVIATMELKSTSTLYSDLRSISRKSGMFMDWGKLMNIPVTYRGIAKCSSEDEFNVEYGMKLARSRALAKYYRAKYNALKSIAAILNDYTHRFNYLGKTVKKRRVEINRDIENLT